jgi:2-keto-4-pentenoate hydratase/2-oxohepta-3-ene-1,7-dioic acid hydratase in catechol pathway
MRLTSFRVDGRDTFGIVGDEGVIDLAARLGVTTLREALGRFGLDEFAKHSGHAPDAPLGDVTWLPVIPDAHRIFCIGLNYEEHRLETKREPTENPTVFLRLASSQVAHEQPLVRPRESTQFDYEGEIAVVIGKGGRRIRPEDAWSHVVGYACYNDGSVRDWQRHTTQWIAGKNFVGTGGFGPWMVTADEIAPGEELTLTTRLNGQVMQQATTDMLIHSIPRQIAYISTWTPLEPGDVIVTGTPGGVGARREPPVWMKPGDVAEIEVSKVGVLRNPVVAED